MQRLQQGDLSVTVALHVGSHWKPMDVQRLGRIPPSELLQEFVSGPPVLVSGVSDQLRQRSGNLRGKSRLFGAELVRLNELRRGAVHYTQAVQEPFELGFVQARRA
ncbi:hypothetical protein D9M68_395630 [compost metagenome]